MKKLYGVITAMTTPFDEAGQVDVKALAAQTEFLIGKGVDCLYPCGTTGEMYLMSAEQRELVAETVVKTAAGRVTVFIHCGAMTQDETIRLMQHAEKIGADGVGVVTPSYFTVDEKSMIAYYKAVCAAVSEDYPVYAYVIPQLAHNDITADTMEKIAAECKNLIGVKYSYPDMGRLCEYLRVRGGNFSVVYGADAQFLPALAMGADGTVSGCSGPFPEPFVEVYKLWKEGKLEEAKAAQVKANVLVKLMKAGADMSIFKHILTWRSIEGGRMHKPLLDLNETEKARLYEQVKPYLE